MSTEHRIDRGDFFEVIAGEPTWDNPAVWSSRGIEWKPGTVPYIEESSRTTIEERAASALADNLAYVALDPPTQAQASAQIKALTRQMNGVIRLLLNRLDSAD